MIDLTALLARLKTVMDTHPDDGGQVLLADGVEDCYEAITRLRAELAAEQSDRSATEEIARQRGAVINALCADIADLKTEVAALKAHDPLAEMWRELSEYQSLADRYGHGESWRKMCEERTAELAWEAMREARNAARDAAWAAATAAAEAAWAASSAAQHAYSAGAAIRKAKEAKP